ncbi:MAG: helix-turn-helix domain-containing protein [Bryobacterales bacterium]|nr:helix-turn-helix domain-containing protein [Bryobacterales bacterium]
MKPGDVFIPYRKFINMPVPATLACVPCNELSQGAKLAYGCLVRHAGKDGRCYPSLRRLGQELGVTRNQARNYISELRDFELIRTIRRSTKYGDLDANDIQFLWHPILESSLRKAEPQGVGDYTAPPGPISGRGVGYCGGPQEGQEEVGSTRGSLSLSGEAGPHKHAAPQEGTTTAEKSFFKAFTEEVQLATRDTWGLTCDRKAAETILDCCGGIDGFHAWWKAKAESLNLDGKGIGYLLRIFRNDRDWIAEETDRQEQERLEAERKRAELQRRMETPVLIADAQKILNDYRYRVTPGLLAYFTRRGITEISPAQLKRECLAWAERQCDQCHQSGLVGSTVRRTLEFCDCSIGQEFACQDPDAIHRMTEAIAMADPQARLAEAFRELRLDFTADAVERSVVVEQEDGELLVEMPREFSLCSASPEHLREAAKLVGVRSIRVAVEQAA